MEMKIGKAVSEVPDGYSKWSEIWKAVSALKNGDWLPVTLEDKQKANRLVRAAYGKFHGSVRGNVVYLRKKP